MKVEQLIVDEQTGGKCEKIIENDRLQRIDAEAVVELEDHEDHARRKDAEE
ncbi:hypothetical protein GCM10010465_23400 [Actinomadura fibrosa]